jgi:hypothetical protein
MAGIYIAVDISKGFQNTTLSITGDRPVVLFNNKISKNH